MKNKIKRLLFTISILLVISCGTYHKTVKYYVSPQTAENATINVLNNLDYSYETVNKVEQETNTYSVLFFKKFNAGAGLVELKRIERNDLTIGTNITIISFDADSNPDRVLKIIDEALYQEIKGIYNRRDELINKKSYLNFFSLTLLNPGIGMIYAHKNHPYYPKWQKWTLSGFLGLIDLPYLYLALKNENSEDFNTGIMGILLWRLAGGFIGAIDIRNFNDVIESGYYFGDLYFSKKSDRICFIYSYNF